MANIENKAASMYWLKQVEQCNALSKLCSNLNLQYVGTNSRRTKSGIAGTPIACAINPANKNQLTICFADNELKLGSCDTYDVSSSNVQSIKNHYSNTSTVYTKGLTYLTKDSDNPTILLSGINYDILAGGFIRNWELINRFNIVTPDKSIMFDNNTQFASDLNYSNEIFSFGIYSGTNANINVYTYSASDQDYTTLTYKRKITIDNPVLVDMLGANNNNSDIAYHNGYIFIISYQNQCIYAMHAPVQDNDYTITEYKKISIDYDMGMHRIDDIKAIDVDSNGVMYIIGLQNYLLNNDDPENYVYTTIAKANIYNNALTSDLCDSDIKIEPDGEDDVFRYKSGDSGIKSHHVAQVMHNVLNTQYEIFGEQGKFNISLYYASTSDKIKLSHLPKRAIINVSLSADCPSSITSIPYLEIDVDPSVIIHISSKISTAVFTNGTIFYDNSSQMSKLTVANALVYYSQINTVSSYSITGAGRIKTPQYSYNSSGRSTS